MPHALLTGPEAFFAFIKNRIRFRIFLFKNLPAAYFSGIRLLSANSEQCEVMIPYKWFTRNPFRSTYFACLSMAAEMSTGILVMANTFKRPPGFSMLVVSVEGKFYKKATGITRFICHDGPLISQAVDEAAAGNSAVFKALASGYNENNDMVAEFWIEWSVKARSKLTAV